MLASFANMLRILSNNYDQYTGIADQEMKSHFQYFGLTTVRKKKRTYITAKACRRYVVIQTPHHHIPAFMPATVVRVIQLKAALSHMDTTVLKHKFTQNM